MKRLSTLLALLWAVDRILKTRLVRRFLRQPAPPAPEAWPSVTMLHPLSRGATGLPATLLSSVAQDYPAPLQHLLICDAQDGASQAHAAAVQSQYPEQTRLVLVAGAAPVAGKITKLLTALPAATGDVLCFIDDDIVLPADGLRQLVAPLEQPGVGATFGLAEYASFANGWSALLSVFVNANALLSYIPLSYLTDPYTITGHVYALRRATFDACGGLNGLEHSIGDDHALAYRLQQHGLRNRQTALRYRVLNHLASARAYRQQMRRWFVIPRVAMAPTMRRYDRAVTALSGASGAIPPLLALLALLPPHRPALRNLGLVLLAHTLGYLEQMATYAQPRLPLRFWPLIALDALLAPLQVVASLRGGTRIEWRGQTLELSPEHFGGFKLRS